jgi:hypothetical protein
MRQKNAQFANKARAGKNPVKPSRQERLAKRSPISLWALGAILFVVVGGSACHHLPMCSSYIANDTYSLIRAAEAHLLVTSHILWMENYIKIIWNHAV